MPRLFAALFSFLIINQTFGQADTDFGPPLDIPMVLSGNFGEIRADHFHSGIDIKTRGTTGHPVSSIGDGYVSRIKVQANGYGNSIYIDHPSGYTSVYGHLDRYREDIAMYVKEMQYKHRSHTIDLYLEPEQFIVHKGELIAYSGNTGGSSGPHLHLEVRTSANQHPTNVLEYGFDIADHTAPRFISLFVKPLDKMSQVNGSHDKQAFSLVRDNGIYTVPYGTRINVSGTIGIHVEVFDYLDGAYNRCGVYTLQLFVDDQPVYSQRMDEFSFSETRYVNAHVDYGELIRSRKKAHRLYRLPNDKLRIYEDLKQDGKITLNEPGKHQLKVIATDVAGNSTTMQFQISAEPAFRSNQQETLPQGDLWKWDEPNRFRSEQVLVEVPPRALYEDMEFTFGKEAGGPDLMSDIFMIHGQETPLQLPYTLSIKTEIEDPELQKKLLLVTLDEDQQWTGAGGTYNRGAVTGSVRNFGSYAIAADTLSPEIIPLNLPPDGDYSGARDMRFTIRDDLSDIDKYDGYIDNRWALFEYDPKNDLLTYRFDAGRLERGTTHELELYISDNQGNVNLYDTTFTW
ncbi:MAG: M23 family metallopeptidase [Bacteroidales bacterium]